MKTPQLVNRVTFEASNLPTHKVTVFSDRAEVCRQIKVNLKTGLNEICVKKFPKTLDNNSIRVEGHDGGAMITEVKYEDKIVLQDEAVTTEKQKTILEKLRLLTRRKKEMEQKLQRSAIRKETLNNITEKFITENVCENDEHWHNPNLLIDTTDLSENLENFLNYYGNKVNEIDMSVNDLNKDLDRINEEIRVLNHEESGLRQVGLSKDVTICLSVTKAVQVELDIFYLVSQASWYPSYDIRVQTEEKELKIIYYGLIRQKTGEDWNNVKLTLSTAMPTIGGEVPELGTTKVSFYKPPKPVLLKTSARAGINYAANTERFYKIQAVTESAVIDSAPCVGYTVARVKDNATSVAFEIENTTSVPTDDSSHKVVIDILDLKSKFQHESVPSKSPTAYFKASVVNSSTLPFLAGPTAIFVNGNFVANGEIQKSVNGGECFEISLGIDPSIKIEYKAAKKFNEEWGLLNKSAVLNKEQKIVLQNTKKEAARITVVEPMPQSTDDKIKVNLLEPNVNRVNDKSGSLTKVNKLNNIEWLVLLAPAESRELILKYQIEYPKGEQLIYNEE